MIPNNVIQDWRQIADWPLDEQVEQDLIISAALVEIFNSPALKGEIAFRGGTALNKLIFPKGLRYSEDIDLNRLSNGPVKPVFRGIREAMKNILPKEKVITETTLNSIKLFYSYPSIGGGTRNLKIEVNVRETLPQENLKEHDFSVNSEFYSGSTKIVAFNTEEMIGTKIRALYQRKKGRDLFDLYKLNELGVDWDKIIASYKLLNIGTSQKEFQDNMKEKEVDATFLNDMGPLLPSNVEYYIKDAFSWFYQTILPKL
jgi:predicted nucleotidyltransferase component of viral defense system